MMEFHISRHARDFYQFDEALFSSNGNVIFANFYAAKLFAQKINQKRDLVRYPEQAVRASQVYAMGLIDEIFHSIVGLYRQQISSMVMAKALEFLDQHYGSATVDQTLLSFCENFPPIAVYRGWLSEKEYLKSDTQGLPNRQIVLEEMLLLWLANINPAFLPYRELFDDGRLKQETSYLELVQGLYDFFKRQPGFGPENQSLIDMLHSPILAAPHSLEGQLEYIRNRWGYLLGKHLLQLLSGLDFLHEEEKSVFGGRGPSLVYEYTGSELEPERFSTDTDWMSSLVLIAKNTYVWLDQLSKRYQRPIYHLDHIPDEELDTLAKWGFSGLWLIGIWERSRASMKIKRLRGNPDAIASAYSIYEYKVAEDLGGEAAFLNLRERAWSRGIRLATDMVPNHMGIDSRWVIEHPDWFLSLDYPPYPSYSFNGPNLSEDERVGIYLEDHYYDGTDAAVVFKRVDFRSGETKYIYHGNDGTNMPWNDTAQLNYLLPEVREAVIQTILDVARKSPIIRFDAAMTLTKRHYQRLWFPEPGSGGAIPTRAEHGMTKYAFDVAMPNEFWREVVDRIAQEAPDTLLLAEAFWLMEGYFVRTLGMHRVYNSAFMNMLRDERNYEYRRVIKNTLEFDPQILKRFVNFMNNPDERTAVEQFGKGDKYFGICTMMVTLPGLPMFGHGQIEGFAEKYGMEYRRAYWDEKPDDDFIKRHVREIFPLLHKRYLFSEVENFLFYDFVTSQGYVNEDVFAYSNCFSSEKALVVYNNRYAEAKGWIHTSVPYLDKNGSEGEFVLVQKTLGQGLELQRRKDRFVIFRDQKTGLEYIRNSKEFHDRGLYIELGAYGCHVFLDFREVQDDEQQHLHHLYNALNGRGTADIESALKTLILQPIHEPLGELLNVDTLKLLLDAVKEDSEKVLLRTRIKVQRLFYAIANYTKRSVSNEAVEYLSNLVHRKLYVVLNLPDMLEEQLLPRSRNRSLILKFIRNWLEDRMEAKCLLLVWALVHLLGRVGEENEFRLLTMNWLDEWQVDEIILDVLREMDMSEETAQQGVSIVRILTKHQDWFVPIGATKNCIARILESWLQDDVVCAYLHIHHFQDILWFNKEAFETFLGWMFISMVVSTLASNELTKEQITRKIAKCYLTIKRIEELGQRSAYQVERLLELARDA